MLPAALVCLDAAAIPKHAPAALIGDPPRCLIVDVGGRLRWIDPATGDRTPMPPSATLRAELEAGPVRAIAISDDQTVVALQRDHEITVVVPGDRVVRIPPPAGWRLRLLALSRDGSRVFAYGPQAERSAARVYDAATGACMHALLGHVVALSACHQFIGTARQLGPSSTEIAIHRVDGGAELLRVIRADQLPASLAFGGDARSLWGYQPSGALWCLDVRGQQPVDVAHGHRAVVAMAGRAGAPGVWIESGEPDLIYQPVPAKPAGAPALQAPWRSAEEDALAVACSGRVALARTRHLPIRIVDLARGTATSRPAVPIRALAMARDAGVIAAAHGTGVALLDATSLAVIRWIDGHGAPIASLAFATASALLTLDDRGALARWEIERGDQSWRVERGDGDARGCHDRSAISTSRCGRWALVSTGRRGPELVDLARGDRLRVLGGTGAFTDLPEARVVLASVTDAGLHVGVHDVAGDTTVEDSADYPDPDRDPDDDSFDRLIASPDGRFVIARRAEWHRGLRIDRKSGEVAATPGHLTHLEPTQVQHDALVTVEAVDRRGFDLIVHDLVSLEPRARVGRFELVDELTTLLIDGPVGAGTIVYAGDARGAVSRTAC